MHPEKSMLRIYVAEDPFILEPSLQPIGKWVSGIDYRTAVRPITEPSTTFKILYF